MRASTQSRAVLVMFMLQALSVHAEMVSLDSVGPAKQAAVVILALKQSGGHDGDLEQLRSGTGLAVRYQDRTKHMVYDFIVTARHVLEGADQINVVTNRNLNATDSAAGAQSIVVVPIGLYDKNRPVWKIAPDDMDLAVVLWESFSEDELNSIPKRAEEYAAGNSKANEAWLANLIWNIGDDVIEQNIPESDLADIFFTGYPLVGKSLKWLHPFTRRCTVANPSAAGLPIEDPNPNYFLIDCPVLSGDSGSPVFIRELTVAKSLELGPSQPFMAWSTKLAGILVSDVYMRQTVEGSEIELTLKEKLHLARVVPARYIKVTIESFLNSMGKQAQ